MKIDCTTIRINIDTAKHVACAEHPDILTRIFWMVFPKAKKPTEVLSITPLFCKYYIAWCTSIRKTKESKKSVRFTAAMNSAINLTRKIVGVPQIHQIDVENRFIVKDKYSQKEAQDRILEYVSRQTYKKLRGLGDVSINDFKVIYKPFYVCVCERNKKKYLRIVDAELGERDYLLEYQYKNLQFYK